MKKTLKYVWALASKFVILPTQLSREFPVTKPLPKIINFFCKIWPILKIIIEFWVSVLLLWVFYWSKSSIDYMICSNYVKMTYQNVYCPLVGTLWFYSEIEGASRWLYNVKEGEKKRIRKEPPTLYCTYPLGTWFCHVFLDLNTCSELERMPEIGMEQNCRAQIGHI